MRVPLPAATMMAEIINRQQGAGLAPRFQAVGCAKKGAARRNRAPLP